MPFLSWVKDEDGKYLWGNRAISHLAQEEVIGTTDHQLIWADNAEALRASDEKVLESGAPVFTQEYVDKSGKGRATLNVCKFVGALEGKRRVFGISFTIE
jgi:PAS domain-containing protein